MGDGSTVSKRSPPLTNVLSGVAAVNVGFCQTCVVMIASGGVRCWGCNDNGQASRLECFLRISLCLAFILAICLELIATPTFIFRLLFHVIAPALHSTYCISHGSFVGSQCACFARRTHCFRVFLSLLPYRYAYSCFSILVVRSLVMASLRRRLRLLALTL